MEFSTDVRIGNMPVLDDFVGHLQGRVGRAHLAWPVLIRHGVIDCPEENPWVSNLKALAYTLSSDQGLFQLEVSFDVKDGTALVAEARRRREIAWGEADWQPGSLCEAAFELMINSAVTPPPADVQFSIEASPGFRPIDDELLHERVQHAR